MVAFQHPWVDIAGEHEKVIRYIKKIQVAGASESPVNLLAGRYLIGRIGKFQSYRFKIGSVHDHIHILHIHRGAVGLLSVMAAFTADDQIKRALGYGEVNKIPLLQIMQEISLHADSKYDKGGVGNILVQIGEKFRAFGLLTLELIGLADAGVVQDYIHVQRGGDNRKV